MGLIRPGPPADLIAELQKRFALKDFVETGTFRAKTAVWASQHFGRVITIEASRQIYEEMHARKAAHANIDFLFGNSRDVLRDIVPKLTSSAVFWLDGHWSGGTTAGEGDECPLLDEIAAIHASSHPHVILVDDAHLFLSPPPPPHRIEQWPAIDAVCEAFRAGKHPYTTVVIEDVIIAAPAFAKDVVIDYCREVARRRAGT